MANNRRNEGQDSGQSGNKTNQHHGSTAEETAALNDTFKAFSEEYHKDDGEKRRRERVKFRIEIGVAIGVALNIALTIGLLVAGIRQAIYSGQQVQASQDQLTVARDTETRQLKAYVGVSQHGVENFGQINQVLKVRRKNYGVTPANDLFMGPPNVAVIQMGTSFSPVFCFPAPKVVNTFTLFPSQESNFEIRGNPINKEQADLVTRGTQWALMYWGALYYKDVFGAERCTRYCFAFKGADLSESTAELCFQHNDSY
jgi:hypothetical protein